MTEISSWEEKKKCNLDMIDALFFKPPGEFVRQKLGGVKVGLTDTKGRCKGPSLNMRGTCWSYDRWLVIENQPFGLSVVPC